MNANNGTNDGQLEIEYRLPDEDIMWKAFIERDPSFTGVFFTGVTSTGIFCLPVCRARKPKREHVVFFRSAGDAMRSGFRPCRICKPTEPPGQAPQSLRRLLSDLEADPAARIRDSDLIERGLDPATVRRWFRAHYNLTFQGFQRLLRLNTGLRLLCENTGVLDAALDSGFESLSGFTDAVRRITKKSPSGNRDTSPVTLTRIASPLGPMVAGSTSQGICLLEFSDRRMLETEYGILERKFGIAPLPGTSDFLRLLESELSAYFSGTLQDFTVPLDPVGSEFQKRVWSILRTIPYGEVWSYSRQARELGDSRLVRAVGGANGKNMIAIVIPCHRVIGEGGDLVGYGGGIWRKKWLLDHELKVRGTQPRALSASEIE